jgi:hypothetical protein
MADCEYFWRLSEAIQEKQGLCELVPKIAGEAGLWRGCFINYGNL